MNFENLSPELQEKLKTCKTSEDLKALAESEGFELSEAKLDGVTGGGMADCPDYQTCDIFSCWHYDCGSFECGMYLHDTRLAN